MTSHTPGSPRFSLRRWSQRKLAATREELPRTDAGVGEARVPTSDAPTSDVMAASSVPAASPPASGGAAESCAMPGATHPFGAPLPPPLRAGAGMPALRVALPPLESLTIDSDFSPFMQPGVDEGVKRSALRKLLRHPQFNVMDGLDVYIDDYSIPSPLEPELVRTLMQARYIFNPPKTRVNADGHVEDIPDEPPAADAASQPGADAALQPAADAALQPAADAASQPAADAANAPSACGATDTAADVDTAPPPREADEAATRESEPARSTGNDV